MERRGTAAGESALRHRRHHAARDGDAARKNRPRGSGERGSVEGDDRGAEAQSGQDCIRRSFGETPIANKTGALDALRSDVGIVYSPKGRVAMAITCDDMPKIDYGPDNKGAVLIAKLAQILVDVALPRRAGSSRVSLPPETAGDNAADADTRIPRLAELGRSRPAALRRAPVRNRRPDFRIGVVRSFFTGAKIASPKKCSLAPIT